MSASTQSVGSLVIDIRADLAQLQADMASVKDTIAKSSRQISSQMSKDMNETRQTLMLLRDDFGIAIPREIAKTIAQSKIAREAIIGFSDALIGIGFITIGFEAIKKVYDSIEKATKAAEDHRQAWISVDSTVQDSTTKILDQLDKQKQKYIEITQGPIAGMEYALGHMRSTALAAFSDIAAEMTKVSQAFGKEGGIFGASANNSKDASEAVKKTLADMDEAMHGAAAKNPSDRNAPFQAEQKVLNDAIKSLSDRIAQRSQGVVAPEMLAILDPLRKELDFYKQINDQIELQKQLQDQAAKNDNESLADEQSKQSVQELKIRAATAASALELKKKEVTDLFNTGQIGVNEEIAALTDAADREHVIKQNALAQELQELQKHAGANRLAIMQVQAEQTDEENNWLEVRKSLNAQYYADLAKMREADLANAVAAQKAMAEIQKGQAFPGAIAASFGSGGAPQLAQGQEAEAQTEKFSHHLAAQNALLLKSWQDMLTPTQVYAQQLEEINLMMEKFKGDPQIVAQLRHEATLLNPEFQKLKEASTEFGKDLTSELDNLILKGESFHDFLKNIITDLAEIILKATLLNSLGKFFSGGGSGTGGFVGFLGHLLGFADGGSPPVGQVSLVGENGPELFVPSTSGTIIPNSKLGGMGGGPAVVIQIQYLDARGADAGVEQRIQRAMSAAMQQSVQSSVAAQIELSRRT